jgi:hypothetical protein
MTPNAVNPFELFMRRGSLPQNLATDFVERKRHQFLFAFAGHIDAIADNGR